MKKKKIHLRKKKEACQYIPCGKRDGAEENQGHLETSWFYQNNDNSSSFLHRSHVLRQ